MNLDLTTGINLINKLNHYGLKVHRFKPDLKSGLRLFLALLTYSKNIVPLSLFNGKGYDVYLGDKNYRVITKYNHSKQYALAIALYAKALKR